MVQNNRPVGQNNGNWFQRVGEQVMQTLRGNVAPADNTRVARPPAQPGDGYRGTGPLGSSTFDPSDSRTGGLATSAARATGARQAATQTPDQQLRALAQRYNVPIPQGNLLERSNQNQLIQGIVRGMAQEYGVPESVALSVLAHESHGGVQWNADGTHLQGQADPADTGAMQINLNAHARNNPALATRLKTNLEANLRHGLNYLKQLHNDPDTRGTHGRRGGFGDWNRTVAAYNHPSAAARGGNNDYLNSVLSEGRERGYIR